MSHQIKTATRVSKILPIFIVFFGFFLPKQVFADPDDIHVPGVLNGISRYDSLVLPDSDFFALDASRNPIPDHYGRLLLGTERNTWIDRNLNGGFDFLVVDPEKRARTSLADMFSSNIDPLHFGISSTELETIAGDGFVTQGSGLVNARSITLGADPGYSGTYTLNDGALNSELWVSSGLFLQNGGAANFGSVELRGDAEGSRATYDMNAGTLSSGGFRLNGETPGNTLFTQTGGESTIGGMAAGVGEAFDVDILERMIEEDGRIRIEDLGGHGSAEISGGSLTVGRIGVGGTPHDLLHDVISYGNGAFTLGGDATIDVAGDETIGGGGYGRFSQEGGENILQGTVRIGSENGWGIYDLDSGLLDAQFLNLENGVFNQNGGTFEVDGIQVGGPRDAPRNLFDLEEPYAGELNFSGGSLTVGNNLAVGNHADGTFNFDGGGATIDVGNNMTVSASAGTGAFNHTSGLLNVDNDVLIGRHSDGEGFYGMESGVLGIGDDLILGQFDGSTGEFSQRGGVVDVDDTLYLGDEGDDARGFYTMDGGELNTYEAQIGDEGFGRFIQNAGVHNVEDDLILGQEESGEGEYFFSGGVLNVGDTLYLGDDDRNTDGLFEMRGGELNSSSEQIGDEGFGRFEQTSGVHSVAGDVSIGQEDRGSGEYELTGDGTLNIGGTLYLGDDSPDTRGLFEMFSGQLNTGSEQIGDEGVGRFLQEGGVHHVSDTLYLGEESTGSGRYEMTDGALTAFNATVGHDGEGTFDQTGGEVRVENELRLGESAGSRGTYNLKDGSLIVKKDTPHGPATSETETIGVEGQSVFVQEGGVHSVGDALVLGRHAGSEGFYDLKDGSLEANTQAIGDEGFGQVTQVAGENTVFQDLLLGVAEAGEGIYRLFFEGALQAVREFIGVEGKGTVLQTGGQNTVERSLSLGVENGGFGGTYDLRGGELKAEDQLIGVRGAGEFVQSGGINTANRSLVLGEDLTGRGRYTLEDGVLISREEIIGAQGSGTFIQTGGRNIVADDFVLSRFLGGRSTYTLDDGELLAGNEWIAHSGEGIFTQNGGTNTVEDTLTIARHPDVIGEYNLTGGTLSAESIVNEGIFRYSGGEMTVGPGGTGEMLNTGDFELSGPGERVIQGDVTNDGTVKTTDTTAVFTGTFTNNGTYYSDPSDNYFVDLIVNDPGYLLGGLGDNFFISRSFQNYSSRNTLWDTSDALLGFGFTNTGAQSGLSMDFYLSGEDFGSGISGYSDNFAWDTLELATGNRLNLFDGNTGNSGTALYVNTLLGLDITGNTVTNVFSNSGGLNIYYLASLSENAYLGGWNYNLAGGGLLIGVNGRGVLAATEPVPEPSTLLLFASGLSGVVYYRRRKSIALKNNLG
ncbi:MAG: PEP-CTERM sorting domain-containing protein [Nitrospiria bacterium]